MARVGFASTDGLTINEHFGHAKFWEIYDIDEDAEFVESRMVQAGCSCGDKKVFKEMLKSLDDCDVLCVAMIGQKAAEFVINSGKRVFEAAGDLNAVIEALIEQGTLSEEKVPG